MGGHSAETQSRPREGKGIFRGRSGAQDGTTGGRPASKGGQDSHGSQDQYYLELGKMMEDLVKEIAPTEGPLDSRTVIKAISSLAAAGQRRLPVVGEEECGEDEQAQGEEDETKGMEGDKKRR
eukprot:2533906-Rhodomonas_salina.1